MDLDNSPDDFTDETPPDHEVFAAIQEIKEKCTSAKFSFNEAVDEDTGPYIEIGVPCGREMKSYFFSHDDWGLIHFSKLDFGKFRLLLKYDGIFSIQDGTVEVAVQQVTNNLLPTALVYRRLFDGDRLSVTEGKHVWSASSEFHGLPALQLGAPSKALGHLARQGSPKFSLLLSGCEHLTEESASRLASKLAGSLFFQIDVLTGVPLTLTRIRNKSRNRWYFAKSPNAGLGFSYPTQQYDDAPLTLYSYARSAANMPLLQFLAYYQVLEFYYPVHSAAAARSRIKNIIKDPTFRVDNDAAISKLLTAIRLSPSGAFGDERSQLRATLRACTTSEDIRTFISADGERATLFGAKGLKNKFGTIPIFDADADLIDATADRIYAIRCRIVHTKSDARDGDVELLLPYTPESESMGLDIELLHFLSLKVLIAGSSPLNLTT